MEKQKNHQHNTVSHRSRGTASGYTEYIVHCCALLTLTVLSLLEQFSKSNAAAQQLLGGCIEVGAELGEGSDLAVLSQFQLH